ncbi:MULTISPECIES: hypothetical protein [Flavobacterium]|uniref:Uncharacterized protein n=1 Tax=Flavobacterium ranwuense TaxID=2541725 RepID=A0ABY2DSN3_9FLAO|nr:MULTISPECIES: hypothetical protein [Flavobacterium]TDE28736.1 hypothetical protein E0I61_10090 [Flavobacterium ranwuense]TDE53072.1 hypothetical protein E0H99_10365 [Flavobacterium sp. GT3P67]
MKNSKNKKKYWFLVIFFCIVNTASYAQINFEDRNLAILEKVAFTTSYKTIKGFMKENNYSFQEENENEIELPNDAFLEVVYLEFKGPIGNTIAACYDKKDKALIGVFNQIAAINTVFCEIQLKDENFKIIDESEDGKLWSKSSYKYQIGTDGSDEKIHRLMFISPIHPDYIK